MTRLRVIVGIAVLALGAPLVSLTGGFGSAMAQTVHVSTGCSNCHQLHGATGSNLTDFAIVEDLCNYCHGPAAGQGAPEDMVVHDGYRHASATTCVDCHTPHPGDAGTNIKLIEQTITTPSSGDKGVVFTATTGTNSFADGNTTLDGVCEVCHTDTDNHINSDPAAYAGAGRLHNAATDCSSAGCHTHEGGFQPLACLSCHNTAQGPRRAVDGEFSLSSSHVPSGVQVLDCRTCHELTQHQGENVRLKDVDDRWNQAAVVQLGIDADPTTTAAEAAKLPPFCLACHDADGAAGSAPFTSGSTPPEIDQTAWTNASHGDAANLAGGCYGDGAFGCHASGHGSEKQKLLAPYTVAPTAPANVEEEEGFCFSCHDADGPSTIDVGTLFAQPVRWVTADAGINNNPNLNDRHDVEYAAANVSGAKIECPDCHDPHTAARIANDTLSLLRRDPDPGDGRSPENNDVIPGMDKYSQWCVDCHDGSFPAGVLDQTTTIVNIDSAWTLVDQMGAITTSSDALKTSIGWDTWPDATPLPCFACHASHGSAGNTQRTNRNLFQLKDVMHEPGPGEIPVPSDGPAGYTVTDNNNRNDDVKGWDWCNTCHTGSMGGGQKNCFNCHNHADGRF